jgi:hypothetical protein
MGKMEIEGKGPSPFSLTNERCTLGWTSKSLWKLHGSSTNTGAGLEGDLDALLTGSRLFVSHIISSQIFVWMHTFPVNLYFFFFFFFFLFPNDFHHVFRMVIFFF